MIMSSINHYIEEKKTKSTHGKKLNPPPRCTTPCQSSQEQDLTPSSGSSQSVTETEHFNNDLSLTEQYNNIVDANKKMQLFCKENINLDNITSKLIDPSFFNELAKEFAPFLRTEVRLLCIIS